MGIYIYIYIDIDRHMCVCIYIYMQDVKRYNSGPLWGDIEII